jgi:hypothetical protein
MSKNEACEFAYSDRTQFFKRKNTRLQKIYLSLHGKAFTAAAGTAGIGVVEIKTLTIQTI